MQKQILTFLILVLSSNFAMGGGINIGSSGDWRKTILKNAKRRASNWTNSVALNLSVIEINQNIPKDSIHYKFLTKSGLLTQLATDIITSEHIYNSEIDKIPEEYTSCAWTNDPTFSKMSDIVFSLKLCQGGLELGGQNYANRLLIHESVHHLLLDKTLRDELGIHFLGDIPSQKQQEDVFCDEIAELIEKSYDTIALQDKDHWQDISPPFLTGKNNEETTEVLQSRGFHTSAWTGSTDDVLTSSKLLIWGGCNEGTGGIIACGPGGYLGDGGVYDLSTDQWKLMNKVGAPSPRAEATSLWTGNFADTQFKNKFIVWGGCVEGDGCEKRLGDGAIYDLATDRWEGIPESKDTIAPRVHHSMIWTGNKLIVWGGNPQDIAPKYAAPLNNGAIYTPDFKSWEKLPAPVFSDGSTFSSRGHHHAFWIKNTTNYVTNNKMLIWGGCTIEVGEKCPQSFNDGALYDPETKSWSRLPVRGLAPKARHRESVVYVPELQKIYVYAGFDTRGNILSDGAVYDLNTLSWSPMANSSMGRALHTSVWANGQLLFFGGLKKEFAGVKEYEDAVFSYTPKTINGKESGVWKSIKTDELIPLKTMHHTAVWTGNSMLVWGGQTSDQQFINLGAKLFLGLDDESSFDDRP